MKKQLFVVLILTALIIAATLAFAAFSTASSAQKNAEVWSGGRSDSFKSGSGTKNDPYLICSGDDLALLAYYVNSGNKQYNSACYRQTEEIFLNNTDNFSSWATAAPKNAWTPIGSAYEYLNSAESPLGLCYDEASVFRGRYDGGGFAVYGLYVTDTCFSLDPALFAPAGMGLFGCANSAVIEKVTLINAYVFGYGASGAVVGVADDTSVINCAVRNSYVSCSSVENQPSRAGGVVGYAQGGDITLCFFIAASDAHVSASGNSAYAGGIAGISSAATQKCCNTGNVSSDCFAGGITAKQYDGCIIDSYCGVNNSIVSFADGGAYGIAAILDNCLVAHVYSHSNISDTGGGIAPYENVRNSYYLDMSAWGASGGTELTETQFRSVRSFSGFDFTNVWVMSSEEQFPYPLLYEQTVIPDYAPGAIAVIAPTVTNPPNIVVWNGEIAQGFAAGNGAQGSPYIISTPQQLAYLAWAVNTGATFNGKYIKLTSDIYLNYKAGITHNIWTPIAANGAMFEGCFSGNGHTIFGLMFSPLTSDAALFASNDGIIEYVTVANSYICGKDRVAAVCAYNRASVSYCSSESCVITGCGYVGGVVGTQSKAGSVSRCDNRSAVYGYISDCGGIAGNSQGEIYNAVNAGKVEGFNNVGGISGSMCGEILSCNSNSKIFGETQVGGIVGAAVWGGNSHIKQCRVIGEVKGVTDSIGGIIGTAYGECTVELCLNTANIVINKYSNSDIYAGGIIGKFCANTGAVTQCHNTGCIDTVNAFSGGIAGLFGTDSTATVPSLNNCYNAGYISGNSGTSGGLIGCAKNSSVNCCYNVGLVISSHAKALIGTVSNDCRASVVYCYFLTDMGLADTVGSGLTSDNMMTSTAYTGFDFISIWTTAGNPNYPFAELKNNRHDGLYSGDVNNDGDVNTGDAVLILRAALGLVELTSSQRLCADINVDGQVNSGDAAYLLQQII